MTTLFRYLAREITLATLFLLAALVALFALFDVIRELGDLNKGQYSLSMVFAYVALSQPARIALVFPIAALLGTLFAIARLSTQSELTVMRASGLSLMKLAGFTAGLGLVFSAVIFLFGEFVAPATEEMAKRVRLSATASNVTAQQFRSGFWVKDDRSFVNIQSVTADTQLLDLRIYEFDASYRLATLKIAKRASYDFTRSRWVLESVEKTTFKEGARIERLATDDWKTAMSPDLLAVLRVKPDDMSLITLNAYIEHLRENRQNSTRYEIAFWGKLFQPLAVIIMMLLAIPFSIFSQRTGGMGAKILLGIAVGLTFVFLNQLASNLTLLNNWPALLSALLPLAAFLAVAVVLMWRKEYAPRLKRATSAGA